MGWATFWAIFSQTRLVTLPATGCIATGWSCPNAYQPVNLLQRVSDVTHSYQFAPSLLCGKQVLLSVNMLVSYWWQNRKCDFMYLAIFVCNAGNPINLVPAPHLPIGLQIIPRLKNSNLEVTAHYYRSTSKGLTWRLKHVKNQMRKI
jgi:hypothetical protein